MSLQYNFTRASTVDPNMNSRYYAFKTQVWNPATSGWDSILYANHVPGATAPSPYLNQVGCEVAGYGASLFIVPLSAIMNVVVTGLRSTLDHLGGAFRGHLDSSSMNIQLATRPRIVTSSYNFQMTNDPTIGEGELVANAGGGNYLHYTTSVNEVDTQIQCMMMGITMSAGDGLELRPLGISVPYPVDAGTRRVAVTDIINAYLNTDSQYAGFCFICMPVVDLTPAIESDSFEGLMNSIESQSSNQSLSGQLSGPDEWNMISWTTGSITTKMIYWSDLGIGLGNAKFGSLTLPSNGLQYEEVPGLL